MSNAPLIKLTKICKFYGKDETKVCAADHVSLEIKQGEFTALVGPSGSGKSTVLNLMSGLDIPSSGEAYLGAKDVSKMSGTELSDFRRDNIGFIFQSYNLIPVLTVAENIEYIMLLQGVSKEERTGRIRKMLSEVGLEGKENHLPAHLSGGQQQRVAVARAMVSQPQIILADEPTANLDSVTGTSLLEMMRHLNQRDGMTFVFSTHDQKIMDRATRIITLEDGKISSDEAK